MKMVLSPTELHPPNANLWPDKYILFWFSSCLQPYFDTQPYFGVQVMEDCMYLHHSPSEWDGTNMMCWKAEKWFNGVGSGNRLWYVSDCVPVGVLFSSGSRLLSFGINMRADCTSHLAGLEASELHLHSWAIFQLFSFHLFSFFFCFTSYLFWFTSSWCIASWHAVSL